MAGTELPPGANLVNDEWFNFGRGNVGGGTGRIKWNPADIRDPFTFSSKAMTPAEAQAAIANALANPIAPVPFTLQGPRYRNGYHIDDVRIEDQQEQKPEDPGRRYVSASTWGRTIPISMGRRRLEGNLLQSSPLVPKLEGTTEYEIVYEIPIYEDPPLKPGGAVTVVNPGDDRPRPGPGTESGCGGGSPCDTRTSSTGSSSGGSFSLTVRDPNPGGPYTVTISAGFDMGTGTGGSASGETEATVDVFLTGSGPWTIVYDISSTNSPPPTVELECQCTCGGSVSGVGNPHTGHVYINADGSFGGMD